MSSYFPCSLCGFWVLTGIPLRRVCRVYKCQNASAEYGSVLFHQDKCSPILNSSLRVRASNRVAPCKSRKEGSGLSEEGSSLYAAMCTVLLLPLFFGLFGGGLYYIDVLLVLLVRHKRVWAMQSRCYNSKGFITRQDG